MIEKLKSIVQEYLRLSELAIDPETLGNQQESIKINKQISDMQEKYELAKEYLNYHGQLEEAKEILNAESDEDMLEIAKEQKKESEAKLEELEQQIKIALLPSDPNDDKNIFLEIRPAAGGDESALFGAELLRMYLAFAQKKGRRTEIVEEQLTDIGGVKFVMVKIFGDKVYSLMKFESGVHRVQRIPDTESQGRVHTSTVTVAIMPEVDEVSIHIDPKDVVMDTYAGSSCGGQNANKNQTGVRLNHKPSGLIVDIGDSKSQLKNKEKAREVLRSRLYQIELDKQQKEQKDIRGNQIGSGDRSEKIRTYNFPQDRITDHRIKQSWSNIPSVLAGNLDEILNTIIIENQNILLTKIEGQDSTVNN
ncbi:MAG TPA: peptide chain release factor 1 [Candidatus Absconditabacterales bacterium]|nr:peptide chain release factor 1 [Candidatus Absconditabacterales bacterium]HOQ79091.1 peptide chain release factor 1 [Candidatus Absconditabacterales bacterium]HPK28221.1 peptide chain release factor 1 [Candidatus Absconditabacterales bacterium]